jgi:hypothetical protein
MKHILTVLFVFALFTFVFARESNAAGDCDGNGTVTISEVQSAINMFLGLKTPALCVDEDASGAVSIAEVQKTINAFLGLSPANTAPVANAGIDQSVAVGALVALDGIASSDADGDALSYSWLLTSKPVGSIAVLSSSTAVKPTFTADVAGAYVVNLVVNDGKGSNALSTVTVTAATSNSTTGTVTATFVVYYAVNGIVVDGNGKGVPWVTVSISSTSLNKTETTDGGGNYTFQVPNGTYIISTGDSRYSFAPINVVVNGKSEIAAQIAASPVAQ